MALISLPLWQLLAMAAALVALLLGALLLGWRLGRESQGKPMFTYPAAAPSRAEDVRPGEDPWTEAMLPREQAQ